jgi:hypothetical protein
MFNLKKYEEMPFIVKIIILIKYKLYTTQLYFVSWQRDTLFQKRYPILVLGHRIQDNLALSYLYGAFTFSRSQ